ncbi:hypothetical protein [Deinococcus xianganensis]|uniref:Uncharacterized protein n=1 Tax=Deinococcus xianganensis TaxID=1507289 RepID=A0A6I4Y6T1_9DEIO|nr:hypothetical protein [Deinococcus xianganensis]MXV18039.1 hypothetical protein [Deinococcus xianganensis]
MKKLLICSSLALTALLSACGGGGGETPQPGNQPPTDNQPPANTVIQATAITGTVSGLPTGTHRALLVNDGDGLDVANEGTVTGGQLTMNLSRVPSDALFPITGGCPFSGQASAYPNIAVYNAVYVASKAIDGLALVQEQVVTGGTLKGTLVARMYSDRAATINGTLDCQGSRVYLKFTLNQGWNALEWLDSGQSLTLSNLGTGATSTLKTSPFPQGVAVSTRSAALAFSSNDTASTEARLYQEGGYTGTVSLSTDLPGLTIEPGTVELPAAALSSASVKQQGLVGALGLSQQRVDTTLTFRYSGTENYSGPVKILVKDAGGKVVGGGQIGVTITRPGVSLGSSYSTFEVTSGGTGTLSLYSYSVGGFSGPVTYSLDNLPAGVTATPVTQDMTSGSSSVTIPVSAASSAQPGTYPVTVRATTSVGSSTLKLALTVKAPTVTLVDSYGSVTLYQGGTGNLQVKLITTDAFNGSTTVTVKDLPAGVSATPRTVNVQPGATTTVNIPLTASADAAPGTYTVNVSSPDLNSTASTQRQVQVSPARAALPGAVSLSAAAPDGMWISAGSTYDTAAQGMVTRVQRVSASGAILADVTLTGSFSRLVSAGSDVIALGSSPVTAVRITEDGKQTVLAALPGNTSTEGAANALDAQGRLWMSSITWGVGAAQTQIFAWDPVTGAVSFKQPETTSSSVSTLRLSPDGRSVLVFPYYNYGTPLKKIDTATGQSSTLDAVTNATASGVAFASDGTLWIGSYGSLSRLNADGSVTTFQNGPSVGTLYGFDQKAPGILWASTGGAVLRIDVSTMQTQIIPVSSSVAGYVAAQGGLLLVSSEYNSSGSTQYYVSLLK